MTEQKTLAAKETVRTPQNPANDRPHNRGADLLKFWLSLFICFWTFGFPDSTGLVGMLSGFAIPAFFILSGYFVLDEHQSVRKEKLTRAIWRSLRIFALLGVSYFLFNAALLTAEGVNWLPELVGKRSIFNFLVLNQWPFSFGSNIWFVQALLYAYLILLLIDQVWGLKHYKIIMAASMILMVLVGELAGVIGFRFYDYAYIPGGALTRALPYVLLGMFMREKRKWLRTVKVWPYLLVFALGAGMAVEEYLLLDSLGKLVYWGHFLGYGVMAAAVCGLAVSRSMIKRSIFTIHGRKIARWVYFLANPLYYALALLLQWKLPQYLQIFNKYAGLMVYAVCLLISLFIILAKKLKSRRM